MERNFSVDDIVGTLWKLGSGTNRNSNSNLIESFLGSESVERTGRTISRTDSEWAFHEFLKNHSASDSSQKQEPGKATMNRNDSLFAFQDFLRTCGAIDNNEDDDKTNGKPISGSDSLLAFHGFVRIHGGSDSNGQTARRSMDRNDSVLAFEEILKNNDSYSQDIDKAMNRNDSVIAFQEFLKNHGGNNNIKQNLGKDMNRNDSVLLFQEFLKNHGGSDTNNLDLGKTVNGNGLISENQSFVKAMNRHKDDNDSAVGKEETSNLNQVPNTDSHRTDDYHKTDVNKSLSNDPKALKASDSQSHPNANENSKSVVIVEGNTLPEQQISGALNPLFTGLQNDISNLQHRNPQEYETLLKRQLDMACAAVAIARSHQRNGGVSTHRMSSVPKSEFATKEQSYVRNEDNSAAGPKGIPALPPKPKVGYSVAGSARMNTSGSSKDQSDDDDDPEVESGQNASSDDVRRMRRMLSNRESARRSRRRKQAHLSDLEMQVAQLRVENSTLFKQLTEITQKFNDALQDNRTLKSDVEGLRVKVRMAEELVTRSITRTVGASTKNDVPIPRAPVNKQEEQQIGIKMGRTPSMQRVASLEHLQKKIRGGVPCSSLSWGSSWDVEGQSMID